MFRQSLEHLVNSERDMQVCGMASAVGDALSELQDIKPDIVLLDLNLSQEDGFRVLEFVKENLAETKVVVVTSYDDPILAKKAKRSGAAAYMLKDTEGDELMSAIYAIGTGKFISNVSEVEIESKFKPGHEYPLLMRLTRMEKKVVQELMNGASVAEMAAQFFISENTVKNHKKNIYRKLDVKTQAELILLCQKNGLLG